MTTTIRTPEPSVNSSSSFSTRCRRDANCTCTICLASINATLDLIPISAQRTARTKHSSTKPAKPSPPETPIFFNPSTVSTPRSESSSLADSPPVKAKIKNDFELKIKKQNMGYRYGLILMMKCVLVLCLVVIGKFGVLFLGSRVMRTKLSVEKFRGLSERALGFRDVKERLRFLNSELKNLVNESSFKKDPNWEIVQDGLILRSRYQLYKSGIEEVSIWGWPLQTAGLLTTEFASRSFTVLSGRVTEWSNGELSCLVRKTNSSWEQGKWSASVWRLDENTWILEYKRSFVFESARPFQSAMEFLKFKMMKVIQRMKDLRKCFDGNQIPPT